MEIYGANPKGTTDTPTVFLTEDEAREWWSSHSGYNMAVFSEDCEFLAYLSFEAV